MSKCSAATRKPVHRWVPLALAAACAAWFLCPAAEVEFIPLIEPPPTKIVGISEAPLGTVVIRFTCRRSPFKADDRKVIEYLEPTYFEVLRKGEHDRDEIAVGRVPGRAAPAAKPAPEPKPWKPTKEVDELVFEDRTTESEVAYTYRISAVHAFKEEGELARSKRSDARAYKPLPRFSLAYLGGDAQRATIRVFIGPKDQALESKDFERIPIGGWVGDPPREFRKPGAAPDTDRFVTRSMLVDVETNVLRMLPMLMKRAVLARVGGMPALRNVPACRETMDRRVILLDPKNRLHYLWRGE